MDVVGADRQPDLEIATSYPYIDHVNQLTN